MPWISRRKYDRQHDPYYYDRRRPSSSCVRDACLLETGCCLAEGLDGNCLMLVLPLLPRLATAFTTGAFTTGAFATAALGGAGRRRGRAARSLVATIRIYQRDISAHRPAVCRFTPSCSEYAAQAVQQRGAVRGAALAARRLLRCRPGGARGLDPVRPAQHGPGRRRTRGSDTQKIYPARARFSGEAWLTYLLSNSENKDADAVPGREVTTGAEMTAEQGPEHVQGFRSSEGKFE